MTNPKNQGRSGNHNTQQSGTSGDKVLDPEILKSVEHWARKLIGHCGFNSSDFEDLLQDLLLTLLIRLRQFDSSRGQISTFVKSVLKNRVIDLVRRRTASNRDYRRCGAFDEDTPHPWVTDTFEDLELHHDVVTLMARMPVQLRVFCALLLLDYSPRQAAGLLDMNPRQLKNALAQLRQWFIAGGWHE